MLLSGRVVESWSGRGSAWRGFQRVVFVKSIQTSDRFYSMYYSFLLVLRCFLTGLCEEDSGR